MRTTSPLYVLPLALLAACGGAPAAPSAPAAPHAPAETTAASPRTTKPSPYPATEKHPVVDTYFGTRVTDDYRWLEDAASPAVQAWTDAQNKVTRARLDALADRPKIRARVAELLGSRPPAYFDAFVRGAQVFAMKDQPPKQQPILVAFADPAKASTERVVIDPNALDPSGKTTIDWFVPSRDGKKLAVSLSTGGSERGDVHLFDAATGKMLSDVVTHVNGGTAGGSLAWNASNTGFHYTRYPREGERAKEDLDFYQQVYFHKLGTPEKDDTYALGKDFPRIAETDLVASEDGKNVLARVANGDGGEFAFYVTDDKGAFAQIAKFEDKIVDANFGKDGSVYLLSRKGAPKGALMRLKMPFATSKMELLVPEGDGVIQQFVATKTRLYVVELLGGPSRLRTFKLGAKAENPEVVDVAFKVPAIQALRRVGDDDIFYRAESYTNAPGWFRYLASTKKSEPTALVQPMPYAMDDVEVVRETCTSKDGTQVPMSILRKKGATLDGSNPTLLSAYGGYGVSRTPKLRPTNRLWLDQSGVFVEANLRGGGEFGEAWHEAGKLANKQNVFDDFYACAKTLVDKGYTKPERFGIYGGSNGGLLMGAEIVQHPEMYRAVASFVGIYDMLRVETTPNGAFNVTEFGTVKDEKLFRALLAYSPLHNVKDGVAYPAVLFVTGANDPRVDPYNSRKMTARLQAATSSDRPILLRASADTGHGMGTPLDAEIEQAADMYAFLMNELGMTAR